MYFYSDDDRILETLKQNSFDDVHFKVLVREYNIDKELIKIILAKPQIKDYKPSFYRLTSETTGKNIVCYACSASRAMALAWMDGRLQLDPLKVEKLEGYTLTKKKVRRRKF